MLNQINLIGHVGHTPESDSSKNGKPFTRFSIAVNDQINKDEVQWFNCVAFGGRGEYIAKYISKGAKVYIEGKMKSKMFDNGMSSEEKWRVMVDKVILLEKKNESK